MNPMVRGETGFTLVVEPILRYQATNAAPLLVAPISSG